MWVSMKTRSGSRLAVSLATLLALAAFACSSSVPDTIGNGESKTKTPSGPAKGANDQNPADKPAGDPAPTTPAKPLDDAGECGKKADAQTCGDCCIAKAPDAWDAADKVYFDCICAATTCQTQCAESVCAAADNENEPTAACKTCLDANDQTCGDKANAACDANAACKAIDACLTSQCDPKEPAQPNP